MTVTQAPGERATPAPETSNDVPARAEALELLGQMEGSGHRDAPSLVRRGDGQTLQLTPLLYRVLEAIDGDRTYADVAAHVSAGDRRQIDADDIRYLVDDKLRPLGVLQRADGSEPAVKRSNPLLALRFRYVVADPDVTRKITAPFARLFHPVVVVPMVIAFFFVCVWTLFTKGLASATHHAFENPSLLLTVFLISVLSAGFHEFGHAAAARYGGATPGAMGAGLYLVWPAFYTDVSDTYRLGRAGRIRTDLGGLYFNAIVGVAMYGLWLAFGWDALLLVIATQVLQMVRQLTPFIRFDGYHILADTIGVPDLYQHIKPTLLGLLPNHWNDPATKTLKPWARAVVMVWVLVVVPLLLGSLVLMIAALPRLLATAWKSLTARWSHLVDDYNDLDLIAVAVDLLAAAAIVVPIFGIAYIALRLVRRIVTKAWGATEGRPVRRSAVALAAIVAISALTWAWWPTNGDYRPVKAWERGTVGDAVAAMSGPSTSLRSGRGGSTVTAWTGGDEALPTRDRPRLAVVLVPADGSDAPSWVFPFDRPDAPEDGDNQALAVATGDGSTVYDVAFALVWADEVVLNDNEAYAFASCTDCRSVAVSFQVILAAGSVDVAVPENVAAAVNYNCTRCVTQALATQLVLTIPEEGLSAAANEQLQAVWRELGEFGDNIGNVPLDQLRSRLQSFETRIVDIVRADTEPATAVPTSTTTSSTTSPSTTSVSSTTSTSTTTSTVAPTTTARSATPPPASTSSTTTSTSTTSTTRPPTTTTTTTTTTTIAP